MRKTTVLFKRIYFIRARLKYATQLVEKQFFQRTVL
jgi:hypothetical protein